jgi:RNA polymerase sigma-70 factor (ECF subfamily)
MDLARAFRSEFAASSMSIAALESSDLEERLAALVARGRAAHPRLALADTTFVRHLAQTTARLGTRESLSAIESLEIGDLYLALACGSGVRGAIELFEDMCGARIRLAVAVTVASEDIRAEAEQRARTLLLVGGPDSPPKIVSYGGQGPLERRVAVVVQRLAITIVRGEGVEQRARNRAGLENAVEAAQPELTYAKEKYRADFESVLRQALTTLPERARTLLRLRLVSGIEVERIGTMYGVSRQTVTRWLADARDVVSAQMHRLLRERLRLSKNDVASLARLVASDLDVSISRLLGAP